MKLLYGTANPSKLCHMQEILQGLDVDIISLNDVDIKINHIDESGNNPLENAKIKATAYYKETGIPVFSCDSGLYIDGITDAEQPGVHVRRVGGKVLDDDEMIEHYSKLALRCGGEMKAKYKNAIALILDENNYFTYDGDDISSESFIITSKPHEKRNPGFPLDSISLERETKRYYMDISEDRISTDDKLAQGFRDFFMRTVLKQNNL